MSRTQRMTISPREAAALHRLLDAYLVTTGIDFSGSMEDGFEFSGVVFDPVIKGVVRLDRVLQASFAVVLVAVGAGVWPAWRASRQDPVASLRAD